MTGPALGMDRFAPALAAYASGDVPPNVALMRLCVEAESVVELETAIETARAAAEPVQAGRLAALRALFDAHPNAFATVKGVIGQAPHDKSASSPTEAVRSWAAVFDGLARTAPDAGVALYGLGSPTLLADATAEVVARMREWGLVEPGGHLLEIGCGSGRFVAALAPYLASVTGLDVSSGMIAAARARCEGFRNVRLSVSNGIDLDGIPDGRCHAVLAADVFPYLVGAGEEFAARHVAEAARVLHPGGWLLILNYSYRGDVERDGRELAETMGRCGFDLRRSGTRDLSLWDGLTFLARRR